MNGCLAVPRSGFPVRRHAPILRRWLTPGIGLKRWLVVVFVGEAFLALAGALAPAPGLPRVRLLRQPGQSVLYVLTLQFLPYWLRGLIVGGLGVGCSSTARGGPSES